MSICIIGDPHFKEGNKRETDKLLIDCKRLISIRNPDFIVILGDVFDEGEYPYIGVILRVIEFIIELKNMKPLYILVGNHDRPNPKVFLTDEHVLGMFKTYPNVTIVDRFHTLVWRNKKICMMPYVQNGRFHEACEVCEVNITNFDLFFSHQEFKGCKINKLNGEDCDSWKKIYPMNISGHIHDKEIVSKNLIYVGTPFQHGFSESYDKGIFFLDENFNLEQEELTIPKKIHYKINIEELQTLSFEKNTNYKVTITGPIDESREIVKNSELTERLSGVKIIYKDTNKIKKRSAVSNISIEKRIKTALKNDERLKRVYKKYISERI